jgi:hypothetical protein
LEGFEEAWLGAHHLSIAHPDDIVSGLTALFFLFLLNPGVCATFGSPTPRLMQADMGSIEA